MTRLAPVLALLALAVCGAAEAASVTTYHNSLQRLGAYKIGTLTLSAASGVHRDTGFNASFSGHVYAQPLYWQPEGAKNGLIVVATESNSIYALNEATGATVWQNQLPASVPLAQLPCGNIDPMGITGTPVIDPATATLYLNALTATANGPRHMLYALSLADGSVLPNWPIDMQAVLTGMGASFDSPHQGSRGALLFFQGKLYVTYGGNGGDCQPYHGTVAQVVPATATVEAYWQTRGARGGIWAQGGIAGDGKDLFVTTGNTSGTTDWADGEAIVRLLPGLAHSTLPRDYFAPSNWQALDASDKDLGGTEALPFDIRTSGGATARRVIAFGKDGNAYLADRSNLGGIGGQLAVTPAATGPIRTAPAIYHLDGSVKVAYFNRGSTQCKGDNIEMLNVAASGTSPITFAWCSAMFGQGSPIVTTTDGVANPIVWAVGAEGDNLLHGFDAMTGAAVFTDTAPAMAGLHHFETILATPRRFYVAADNTVYAYALAP
jgi:outer membrane protein assembly factor BamB